MTTHPESLWLAVRGAFRGGLTLGEVQEAEDELNRLTRERDALLEALKDIAGTDPVDAALDPQRAVRIARAAIKAVEGEKT